ncbi:MAG: biotin carboxylase N-terminal domain-containing protein [Betaproteobacteria bacterium]
MFSKIVIANRGEIACRIARTARRLGVRTVGVYSDADEDALHVALCDEAYRIGPPPARASYLDAAAIIAAARRSGAQAIHPGYGFLSENEHFAQACADAGIVFVGPAPAAIAAMGSKSAAKAIMSAAGVPVVPGYHGDDQDAALLAHEAARIGYPVLIKATAGGGGKGMKVAGSSAEFAAALASAQREARASFGDDRVLIERYLRAPRHIEMQVFADTHGNVVHLFERDCSVQRRHQKVVEEAPAPGMDAARRRAMGDAAIAACRAIGYVGAGTIEFIAEQDGTFYFMEMNTRLQVEHPVTEMITGLDLVEWQLRVAAGETLPRTQDEITMRGHAIEVRVYAEDPERDFLPSVGRIAHWRMPTAGMEAGRETVGLGGGLNARVRVDTGYREGDEVTAFYDPLLAKVIAWGEDREGAREGLLHALGACEITGVTTNLAFLERVLGHEAFTAARLDTGLIAAHRDTLLAPAPAAPRPALIAAVLAEYRAIEAAAATAASRSADPYSPWHETDAWWNGTGWHRITVAFDHGSTRHALDVRPRPDGWVAIAGEGLAVEARARVRGDALHVETREPAGGEHHDGHRASVVAEGDVRHVFVPGARVRLVHVDPLASAHDEDERGGHLMAPMSGTVVAVLAQPGDEVEKGAALMVLEAMKMEHTIAAPTAGRVVAVHFAVGDRVSEGADLVDLEEAEGS